MRSAQKGRNSSDKSLATIRVSEIGEWSYCHRAWWYKHVIKLPTKDAQAEARLKAGTEAHRRHGAWVRKGTGLRTAGLLLALCGSLAVGLAVALFLLR